MYLKTKELNIEGNEKHVIIVTNKATRDHSKLDETYSSRDEAIREAVQLAHLNKDFNFAVAPESAPAPPPK